MLECVRNLKVSLDVFENLGFVVHPVKSVFDTFSCQFITIYIHVLGFFALHSVDISVTLTEETKERITHSALKVLKLISMSVRILAKPFIGQVVAAFPGVQYGSLL